MINKRIPSTAGGEGMRGGGGGGGEGKEGGTPKEDISKDSL